MKTLPVATAWFQSSFHDARPEAPSGLRVHLNLAVACSLCSLDLEISMTLAVSHCLTDVAGSNLQSACRQCHDVRFLFKSQCLW